MRTPRPPKSSTRPRRRALAAGSGAALALALAGGLAAVALASSGSLTVGSASNSTLEETVVVNSAGRTLYALSPETTHHLLCKSSTCLSAWPPLTVHSKKVKLKDGSGVHGTLALLRRPSGTLQVTLRGKPLYRYSGDGAKGEANGDGLKSFGGTWHAVTGSASPASSPPPAGSPAPVPTYGY